VFGETPSVARREDRRDKRFWRKHKHDFEYQSLGCRFWCWAWRAWGTLPNFGVWRRGPVGIAFVSSTMLMGSVGYGMERDYFGATVYWRKKKILRLRFRCRGRANTAQC